VTIYLGPSATRAARAATRYPMNNDLPFSYADPIAMSRETPKARKPVYRIKAGSAPSPLTPGTNNAQKA